MVHTKFCQNRLKGSRKNCLKLLYYIWALQPSWSCDTHPVNEFLFHCTLKLTKKLRYNSPVVSEKSKF